MEEPCVAERKVLSRQSSFSLRIIKRGKHRLGYIEHSSAGYLFARDRCIGCEPLKREDKSFEHSLCPYDALNDEGDIVFAVTVSRLDIRKPQERIYLCVEEDKSISLQELDLPDEPKMIPDEQEFVFFRIRHLTSDYVCFESTHSEMYFLAVEDDRVCLRRLTDFSEAAEIQEVQFKIYYIH